ncbi:MAG: DNA-protecting protein DprA [Nevskiaceae bacterium]|nr:MAG: DNA-protecting protein DprA [Nevskiaceae bacterium]TBR72574.1 MAG: DNA-protecting protein DprA [Nevskiaceae bacterium]
MPAAGAERRAWLALVRAPGIGPIRVRRLFDHFGSAAALLDAGPAAWRAAGLADRYHAALKQPDAAALDADERWLAAPGRTFIALDDPRYPQRLREIAAAPIGLFTLGDIGLLDAPQLAIVGARRATLQARRDAAAFAAELVRGGFTVTSGLATGIDGAAHKGALDAGGTTLAVCANGLDRVYPPRHHELAHAIAERGLLVSEFPPGVTPRPEYFPRRNRVISGLSVGVLVVEAARRSGSLITARLAAEQGREVFAVPGSIHNPLAQGCHDLIRDGARLVESAADIFEELGVDPPTAGSAPESSASTAPDALQQRILDALGFEPLALDRLIERLDVPVGALHEALLTLELTGQITSAAGDVLTRLSGKNEV